MQNDDMKLTQEELEELEEEDCVEVLDPDWYQTKMLSNGEIKQTLIPSELVKHLIGKYHFKYYEEEIFGFENGCYKKFLQSDIQFLTNKYLIKEHRIKKNTMEVFEQIFYSAPKIKTAPHYNNLVNVKNGIIKIGKNAEITFEEHTPDIFNINQLPVEYDPKLTLQDAPSFERWIMNYCNREDGAEKLKLLQEIFGACLVHTPKLKKFALVKGRTDTGKSGFNAVLNVILGEENYSVISLAQLADAAQKFVPNELRDKLVNIDAEVSAKALQDDALLKKLTGGDVIFSDRKFKSGVKFKNSCFNIFICNEFPYNLDHGNAFVNRIVAVDCDMQVPKEKQDNSIYEKFEIEKNAIFTWMLAGLQRLITNDFKFSTNPQSSSSFLEEYKKETDNVYSFYCDCLSDDESESIPLPIFYHYFKEYVIEKNGPKAAIMKSGTLLKKLKEHTNCETVRKPLSREDQKRWSHLNGMAMKVYNCQKYYFIKGLKINVVNNVGWEDNTTNPPKEVDWSGK